MTDAGFVDRSPNRRIVFIVLAALAAVLVGCALWVGIRTALARTELDAAVPLANEVRLELLAANGDSAAESLAKLSEHTGEAVELTSDPIFAAAQFVPVLGSNLSAFRQIAESVNQVASEGLAPLVPIAGTIDATSLRPAEGAIDFSPLVEAAPALKASRDVLQQADADVAAIDTSTTLPPVTDAVERLSQLVGGAADTVTVAANTAELLPAMLGSTGDRNYLLVFQNNAEVRASGGLPGAFALVQTSAGRMSLTAQASAADFRQFSPPVSPIDEQTEALYGDGLARRIQNVNSTPDFPTSAVLASEMWREQFGVSVDGVVAVDPVLLGYLLEAAGPITLASGDVIDSDNAVQFLISEVYSKYPDPLVQDVVFADAARRVFDALASGSVDQTGLLEALQRGAEERRVLIWNVRDEEQTVLEDTSFAGAMPATNERDTVGGVFLNDLTGGKMDFYLRAQATAYSDTCASREDRTWRTELELTSTAPADAATSLPIYVTGGQAAKVPRGTISTQVTIYGPVGSIVRGVQINDRAVRAQVVQHLGRGAAQVVIDLLPGEKTVVAVDLHRNDVSNAPASIHMTPLVHAPSNEVISVPC